MEIDIISYTDEQYAKLSPEQLLEVKAAQLKKNKLDQQLQKDIDDEKNRLATRGILLSKVWNMYCDKLRARHEEEVTAIREALLFYLRFSNKPTEEETEQSPYVVDYSLTFEARLVIVRDYYNTAYTDDSQRFEAFKADEIAPQYLGEFYAPLYDYFLNKVS